MKHIDILMDEINIKSKPYYVYELIDPRNNAVFYVGKGKGNRIKDHVAKVKRGSAYVSNKNKNDRIADILLSGVSPIERIVDRFSTDGEAVDAEESLIAHYGISNLTNLHKKGAVFVYRGRGETDARLIAREMSRMFAHFVNPNGFVPRYPSVVSHGELIDIHWVFDKMVQIWDTAFSGEHRKSALEALNKEIETKHYGACRLL